MKNLSLLIKPASGLCNLRCRYCFYSDVAQNRRVPSYGVMKDAVLDALVRSAFAEAEESVSFAFQGGEPTLAGIDFFRRFLGLEEECNVKKLPVKNSIQTNGTLLDAEWAELLARGKFLVGLSLDGPPELNDLYRRDAGGKGCAEDVLRAARLLRRTGVEFNILCVVNASNARHPTKLYGFFRGQGFRYLQFIPCLDGFDAPAAEFSLTPELYRSFLIGVFDRYYEDFVNGTPVSVRLFDNYIMMLLGGPPESCDMAGRCTCSFTVESDGGVYPCDFYVLDEWRLGDIRADSFDALRSCAAAKSFAETSAVREKVCGDCEWLPLCRGGCRRQREPFPAPNRFCEAYKGFFDARFPRLRELARRAAAGQAPKI